MSPLKRLDRRELLRERMKAFMADMGGEEADEEGGDVSSNDEDSLSRQSKNQISIGDGQQPRYLQLSRYSNMVRLGLPDVIVLHRMGKDGVADGKEILKQLKEEQGVVADTSKKNRVNLWASRSSNNGAKAATLNADGLPLGEDPRYSKYFKLLKAGVSRSWVKGLMEVNGVDVPVLDSIISSTSMPRAPKTPVVVSGSDAYTTPKNNDGVVDLVTPAPAKKGGYDDDDESLFITPAKKGKDDDVGGDGEYLFLTPAKKGKDDNVGADDESLLVNPAKNEEAKSIWEDLGDLCIGETKSVEDIVAQRRRKAEANGEVVDLMSP